MCSSISRTILRHFVIAYLASERSDTNVPKVKSTNEGGGCLYGVPAYFETSYKTKLGMSNTPERSLFLGALIPVELISQHLKIE